MESGALLFTQSTGSVLANSCSAVQGGASYWTQLTYVTFPLFFKCLFCQVQWRTVKHGLRPTGTLFSVSVMLVTNQEAVCSVENSYCQCVNCKKRELGKGQGG